MHHYGIFDIAFDVLIEEETEYAKTKKESQPFSIRMDKAVYERLNEYCEELGLSQTVAIGCASWIVKVC